MSLQDWLTLGIAVYGAVVSTILGIRELRKEKRNIAIFLEFRDWSMDYTIVITNVGHRPVTLMDLHAEIPKYGGAVPRDVLGQYQWPFPVTLTDGEHVSIRLPLGVSDEIRQADGNIEIVVYDAEGNSYNKYKRVSHDSKYGTYRKS